MGTSVTVADPGRRWAPDPLRVLLVAPPMLPGPAADVRGHGAGRRRDRRRAPPPRPRGRARRRRRLRRALRAHPDRRAEPVAHRLPRRRRELHAAHDRGRVARGAPVRHRPRPHGEPRLRVRRALRDAGDLDDARPPRRAGMPELLEAHRDVPLVAISESQRRWFPDLNWVATIHHGLPLETHAVRRDPRRLPRVRRPDHGGEGHPGGDRAQPHDGVPLRVAAKVSAPSEQEHFDEVVQPASTRTRSSSWARSARSSATRCMPARWRP